MEKGGPPMRRKGRPLAFSFKKKVSSTKTRGEERGF